MHLRLQRAMTTRKRLVRRTFEIRNTKEPLGRRPFAFTHPYCERYKDRGSLKIVLSFQLLAHHLPQLTSVQSTFHRQVPDYSDMSHLQDPCNSFIIRENAEEDHKVIPIEEPLITVQVRSCPDLRTTNHRVFAIPNAG